MRMVSHPNVVNLHAFFYSNGEKVGRRAAPMIVSHAKQCCSGQEGRSLPQSRPRIRSRNRLSRVAAVCEIEADYAHELHQALHVRFPEYISYPPLIISQVPTSPLTRLHPLSRNLPSRHQTSEPSTESTHWYSQTVRFRIGKDPGGGRAKCLVHLLEILPRARAYFRCYKLHNEHR